MLTERIPINPELARILEGARANLPVPDIVRARVMARARAATSKPMLREAARGQRRRIALVALAASVSLIFGATGIALALFTRHVRPIDRLTKPEPAPALAPPTRMAEPPVASPALAPVALSPKPATTGRPRTPQESYAAELDLLYRSHAAYAAGHFTRALALLAEHGRRFPKGQLTEEREALRVRALAGAGRTEEAKRAAEAFAQRFPHSLLLPR